MTRFKVGGVSERPGPARQAKGGAPAKPKALPEPRPAGQVKPAGDKDDFFDSAEMEGLEKF
jgi:hypothetical protein